LPGEIHNREKTNSLIIECQLYPLTEKYE